MEETTRSIVVKKILEDYDEGVGGEKENAAKNVALTEKQVIIETPMDTHPEAVVEKEGLVDLASIRTIADINGPTAANEEDLMAASALVSVLTCLLFAFNVYF